MDADSGLSKLAYMVINVATGCESEFIKQLEGMGCDRYRMNCHMVYGVYDVVAELYGRALPDVKEAAEMIREIDSVESTLTFVLV